MGLKDLFAAHADETKKTEKVINISGMHCNGCEKRVSVALEELGATDVTANHETGVVTYCGDLDNEAIREAITALGFEVA